MNNETILIANDDATARHQLTTVLEEHDYKVLVAKDGYELVQLARERASDLLIIDLTMSHLDGHEAVRQLRNDTRTAHIPIILMTVRSSPQDVVIGFESGADDYVVKPFKPVELIARIRRHLQRAAQRPVHSPLTGLPGNTLITEEIRYRLEREEQFTLLYVDLNNFKGFNDAYGFARGDDVIKLIATILRATSDSEDCQRDFIGHVGGDDFTVITTPQRMNQVCATIIAAFDSRISAFYDQEDFDRGYLDGVDRHGVAYRFPILSIGIGGVTSTYRVFNDQEDMCRVAAEMKHFAKTQVGSVFSIDIPSVDIPDMLAEQRDQASPTTLITSNDQ